MNEPGKSGIRSTHELINLLRRQSADYFATSADAARSLIAIYLFGSYAAGNSNPRSDLDLAFLYDARSYRRDPFETGASAHLFAARLAVLLDLETDVVILNSASVELAYEVATTGVCIFASDADKRLEYEALARSLYYDFKPFLDELRARRIQSIQQEENS